NQSTQGLMMTLVNNRIMSGWELSNMMGALQLIPSSLVDNGTLMAASMIRLFTPANLYGRNCAVVVLALGIWLLLIKVSLGAAKRVAIRQSALRPAVAGQSSSTTMRMPTG